MARQISVFVGMNEAMYELSKNPFPAFYIITIALLFLFTARCQIKNLCWRPAARIGSGGLGCSLVGVFQLSFGHTSLTETLFLENGGRLPWFPIGSQRHTFQRSRNISSPLSIIYFPFELIFESFRMLSNILLTFSNSFPALI